MLSCGFVHQNKKSSEAVIESAERHSRHRDHHEVQPVPRISQEREVVYTEASGDDFDGWFERINSRERVSMYKRVIAKSLWRLVITLVIKNKPDGHKSTMSVLLILLIIQNVRKTRNCWNMDWMAWCVFWKMKKKTKNISRFLKGLLAY